MGMFKDFIRAYKAGLNGRDYAPTKKRSRNSGNGWRYQSSINARIHADIPNVPSFEVPAGEHEIHVFVYDGRPLKGTRKGSKLVLNVVPGTVTMTSVYTGTEWTGEPNETVAYNGYCIGHMGSGSLADALRELVRTHPNLLIHARRDGTDKGGWPIITIEVPS